MFWRQLWNVSTKSIRAKAWLPISEREFKRYQICKLLVKPIVNRICAYKNISFVKYGK